MPLEDLQDKLTQATIKTADKISDSLSAAYERKHTIPQQVPLKMLFKKKKLFNNADFDYVINFLQQAHISDCKGIYTINSLAGKLVPEMTLQALVHQDSSRVSTLYTAILLLCKRFRKGLLVYIDLPSKKIVKLTSFAKFCEYAQITDSDILLDTYKVFSKLKKQPSSTIPRQSPHRTTRDITSVSATEALNIEESEPETQTTITQESREYFLQIYQQAARGYTSDQESNFDWLMLRVMYDSLGDLAHLNIQALSSKIIQYFSSLGITDLQETLAHTKGQVAQVLRYLFNISGEDGIQNDIFINLLHDLLKTYPAIAVTEEYAYINEYRPATLSVRLLKIYQNIYTRLSTSSQTEDILI